MAGPAPPASTPTQPRRRPVLRCIAITALVLIVAIGAAVITIWLVIKPAPLSYTVEDASVHGLDLKDRSLNATFRLSIRAHNPNRKVSLYYDYMDVAVWYDDQPIAFGDVAPFFQPRRNATRIEANATARSTQLSGSVARDLGRERSSRKVELEVRMKAKIRFKLGIVKSKGYKLRVYCSPVVVHLTSSKSFDRTYCDVDI